MFRKLCDQDARQLHEIREHVLTMMKKEQGG
jgi:hypothetical protein